MKQTFRNASNITISLEDKQTACLRNTYNLMILRCLAHGKSLIFQILPFLQQRKQFRHGPMIVIVVVPLNSIMEDEVQTVVHGGSIRACFLSYDACSVKVLQ